MHSRIFEVVEIKDNAIYESRIDADEIYDWCNLIRFYDYIVDMDKQYVDDSIRWFEDSYPALCSNGQIKIDNELAEEYFKPKFDLLKTLVDNLTLTEFSNKDDNFTRYNIADTLNDEYSFHIAVQDDGCLYGVWSLDDFMRLFRGEYKIVNAFDYHF